MQAPTLPELNHSQEIYWAICQEHQRNVHRMARALGAYGWPPLQIAYVSDYWHWSWLAAALANARQSRGEPPVDPALVLPEPQMSPEAKAARCLLGRWRTPTLKGPEVPPPPPWPSGWTVYK